MINGKVSSKEKEEFCQDWRIHPTDFNILKSIVSIKDKRPRNKLINNLVKEIPHFKELSKIIREAKRPKEIPPKHYFPWIKFYLKYPKLLLDTLKDFWKEEEIDLLYSLFQIIEKNEEEEERSTYIENIINTVRIKEKKLCDFIQQTSTSY